MKRRNFIQALLGTAAIAPLLPLIARCSDEFHFCVDSPCHANKWGAYLTANGFGDSGRYYRIEGRTSGGFAYTSENFAQKQHELVEKLVRMKPRMVVTAVDPTNKTFTVDTV